MGVVDSAMLNAQKKQHEEQATLLRQLIAEQQRTNQLLEWLGQVLAPQQQARVPQQQGRW